MTGILYEAELDSNEESKKLGSGAFGSVVRATDTKHRRTVAVKITQASREEIDLMLRIPLHENIVELIDYWIDGFSNKYIVMELADSDLAHVVDEEWSEKPSNTEMRSYVLMLNNGLKHLHENHIIHRDIKPANVLRFELNNGDMVFKITDFGISRQMNSTYEQQSTMAGTRMYMAPEMIKEEKYTKKIDIWAMGLLFYYMCTGKARFSKTDEICKFEGKFGWTSSEKISLQDYPEVKCMIENMIHSNPEKRTMVSMDYAMVSVRRGSSKTDKVDDGVDLVTVAAGHDDEGGDLVAVAASGWSEGLSLETEVLSIDQTQTYDEEFETVFIQNYPSREEYDMLPIEETFETVFKENFLSM